MVNWQYFNLNFFDLGLKLISHKNAEITINFGDPLEVLVDGNEDLCFSCQMKFVKQEGLRESQIEEEQLNRDYVFTERMGRTRKFSFLFPTPGFYHVTIFSGVINKTGPTTNMAMVVEYRAYVKGEESAPHLTKHFPHIYTQFQSYGHELVSPRYNPITTTENFKISASTASHMAVKTVNTTGKKIWKDLIKNGNYYEGQVMDMHGEATIHVQYPDQHKDSWSALVKYNVM